MKAGLVSRLALLAAIALSLGALVIALAFKWQRNSDTGTSATFPLPDQIAAIVQLLDAATTNQRPTVLRALNSIDMRVQISSAEEPLSSIQGRPLEGLAWNVARYLNAVGNRETRAQLANDPNATGRELFLAVELQSGEWVVITIRDQLLRRLGNQALWILLAILLFLILLAAFIGLRKEIRPLERLATVVDAFGTPDERPLPPPEGAMEMRRLNEAFVRMTQRIHSLIAHRSLLFAAISHDFGTYLTRLRLRLEDLPQDLREGTESDLSAMEDLLNETLIFAKATTSAEPLKNTQVDVSEVLRDVAAYYAESNASVVVAGAETAWVVGTTQIVSRILYNLINNALKYGKRAEVRLVLDGEKPVLLVEDQGPGMSAEIHKLAIAPFWKGDNSRNLNAPGWGLGLAIVDELLRQIGGEMSIMNRPEGGLRVRIQFLIPKAPIAAENT